VFYYFVAMNSVLMNKVLNNGVDRHDFCELVGIEVYVPTDEMYDLTEQAYAYSSTLYDIYGASDQFEKKADSFFKKRNLSKKVDSKVDFGDFSYDKVYKYFELLGQQHDSELAELQKELEQLESEKSLVKEQALPPQVVNALPPKVVNTTSTQVVNTQPPQVVKVPTPQVLNASPPKVQRRPTQAVYTPKRVLSVLPPPPSPRALYTPPPPPSQALYAPPPPPTPGKSQDVRCSGRQTQLNSIFATGGMNNQSNLNTSNVGLTKVYPNGHHFPCTEPMWC